MAIKKTIEEDIKPFIDLRNRIAHGQWSIAFNNLGMTKNQQLTQKAWTLSKKDLMLFKVVISNFPQILKNLILSTNAFEKEYDKLIGKINLAKKDIDLRFKSIQKKKMKPNKKEIDYLTLAYNRFYDIFEEVFAPEFWHKDKYYRYCKIKDAFSVYVELLNYEPIQLFIETLRKTRPPMEAEISSELFRLIRNVISHFPFFNSWDDIWISKDIINWYKDGQSIDKFLRKFEKHEVVKYRIWEEKNKSMTYLSINFPNEYTEGTKIFLKNLVTEKEGLKFSLILMKKVIDSQVEEIS